MIKPIKKKLLPNTATYQKYLGDSAYGDTYDTVATLTNVAIQLKKVKQSTANGLITVASGLLVIDKYYSKLGSETITNDDITIKSKVTYNDIDYTIIDVEGLDYELGQGYHHWEVTLI